MKTKIYFAFLLLSGITSAQIKGNATIISRQNFIQSQKLSNTSFYENNLKHFRNKTLIPNASLNIDVKVLSNVIADAYTAVFNVVQIGKTSEETNRLMNEGIHKIKNELSLIGIPSEDFVIDVISFVPIYETVVEHKLFSKKYHEVPKGFNLQKNIHVKFTKVNQFEKILAVFAKNEVYNLVKVDYFINNIEAVYTQLRAKILKILKEKQQFYIDMGFNLANYTPTMADMKYCFFPKEFYKNYQAFNSTSMEALKKNKGVVVAKKPTSYYYEPLSFKAYDLVINPSIVEPVIQIGMEVKLQYAKKIEKENKEIKEKIKNKFFMISDKGTITVKELKLTE